MSTDQPPPGPGEPPENDPFQKRPPQPPAGGTPDPGAPRNGSPHGAGPNEGTGAPPPGGAPPPPPPGAGPPPSYGGGPHGGGPYGGPPAGGPYGSGEYGADPLAGMPPLANRGKRLLARIIDAIIIGVPVTLIMNAIVGWVDYFSTSSVETSKQATVSGVAMLVYLIYEGVMLTTRGQTVGKMAMRIRVAMLADGSIPTPQAGWTRAAVYTLPEIVPCCGFIFWLVNVLWCTWDKPYQQCLHDKAARTVVVATD
ncbi:MULTISPECIES: RDD family protein [unclassified Streptomyces]|uniref:RDD family protein n=1 Tax=unclassified Streptomyces TaxID=2593676 RepID=UPI00036376E2|nr:MULTISPECIES: RDD family protein [unclassified Streptomyces]MYT30623.1 RDD family protein [Streptomyces sp. SID8354]